MLTTTEIVADKASIPTAVTLVATLLVADGMLALFGCIVYQGGIPGRLYGGAGAAIILATGLAILLDHRSALPFSVACAVVLTADQLGRITLVNQPFWSIHVGTMGRAALNISLYWIGYTLYRSWRRRRAGPGV